jgi:hypothetical protein
MMKRLSIFLRLALAAVLLATAVVACGNGEPEVNPDTIPFFLDVVPVHMADTIAGQSCVFMVTVTDDIDTDTTATTTAVAGNPVKITAEAPGASVTVGPEAISAGYVAEVVVVPEEVSNGDTIMVSITGQRGEFIRTETATLNVREEPEDIIAKTIFATALRDIFVAWLEENEPDIEITSDVEWTGAMIYPYGPEDIGYYLFFSEEWEMGVRWHSSDGFDDWAKIYLRMRTIEVTPSKAFEIASMKAEDEPRPIPPPKEVWR